MINVKKATIALLIVGFGLFISFLFRNAWPVIIAIFVAMIANTKDEDGTSAGNPAAT